MSYLAKIGDAFSQLMNVILFNGDPNQSISGDAYRLNRYNLRALIDSVLWFDEDHCRQAYLKDVEYARKLLNAHHDAH
jgi:hypothetical protein